MRTFDAVVRTNFRVEVDETKFTPEFFEEFSSYMWTMTTVEEAVEHLADLFSRGIVDGAKDSFIEGFGPAAEMGIRFIVDRASPWPHAADLSMEVDITPVKEAIAV